MKTLLKELVYRSLSIFGSAFADRRFPIRVLLRHVFIQKILRINAHVPWLVHWTSTVKAPSKIQKGSFNPGLSMNCYLDGRNGIVIGKNVWIGPKVSIISMNHKINDYPQYVTNRPIVIGDNCWLATNATILAGVKLGNHVVVASGAVVTKSFLEDDVLLAGVPARITKHLPPYIGDGRYGLERET